MKYVTLFVMLIGGSLMLQAQQKYPEPEFSNEVYYLEKDSIYSVVRLEKGTSKLSSKAKMAGYGGTESGYSIDEAKSGVRLNLRQNHSFVFSTGASTRDSTLQANGIDLSMVSSMTDPVNTISLYKAETTKDQRKILVQKTPGAFGGRKIQSSLKYTFSVKKIREGYWEMVIDKTLPRGEYMFIAMGMGMGNMDGSMTIFAFAVE